mmetsp:Transcript_62792/g.187209  ORF Transcript_62792/g.187209 Transcript_62792/m.187209 type:complete len:205 (+) Transcript_62792:197-811(+)
MAGPPVQHLLHQGPILLGRDVAGLVDAQKANLQRRALEGAVDEGVAGEPAEADRGLLALEHAEERPGHNPRGGAKVGGPDDVLRLPVLLGNLARLGPHSEGHQHALAQDRSGRAGSSLHQRLHCTVISKQVHLALKVQQLNFEHHGCIRRNERRRTQVVIGVPRCDGELGDLTTPHRLHPELEALDHLAGLLADHKPEGLGVVP